jgi:hypothetical protein
MLQFCSSQVPHPSKSIVVETVKIGGAGRNRTDA